MVNPSYAGTYTQFRVELLEGETSVVLERSEFTQNIVI